MSDRHIKILSNCHYVSNRKGVAIWKFKENNCFRIIDYVFVTKKELNFHNGYVELLLAFKENDKYYLEKLN